MYNKFAKQLIMQIKISCPNSCGIVAEVRHMDKHQKLECAKREVTCAVCKIKMSVQMLKDHVVEKHLEELHDHFDLERR